VSRDPEDKGGRIDVHLRTLNQLGKPDERQTAVHPKVVQRGWWDPGTSIEAWLVPANSMRQSCIIRELFPRNEADMGQKEISKNVVRLD
jgi:hypothetical protein